MPLRRLGDGSICDVFFFLHALEIPRIERSVVLEGFLLGNERFFGRKIIGGSSLYRMNKSLNPPLIVLSSYVLDGIDYVLC